MLALEFKIPPLAFDMKVDTESMLDDAAAALLSNVLTRFMAELSPDGKPWLPSRASLRRKLRGVAGGTLYDTGAMFNSIKVTKPGQNTRSIGTTIPYAAKHNYGLDGMTKREFLGVADSDFAALQGVLDAHLKDYIK